MGQTPYQTADDWQGQSAAVTAEAEEFKKQLQAERQQVQSLQAEIAAKDLEVSNMFDWRG
jgi:molecular chaperone GrpE (heat shock protein)